MLTFFSDIIFAIIEMYLSVVKSAAWCVLDNNLNLEMQRKRMAVYQWRHTAARWDNANGRFGTPEVLNELFLDGRDGHNVLTVVFVSIYIMFTWLWTITKYCQSDDANRLCTTEKPLSNHIINTSTYGTQLLNISSTTLVIIVYFNILSYLKIHDIANSFTTNLIQSPRTFIRMGRYTRNILLLQLLPHC